MTSTSPRPLTQDSKILIVGAGAFGLSTALHLAYSGYKNVTVFDTQPYDKNLYSTTDGADAASADLNKVMRMSYGKEMLYQRLAFEGKALWDHWNQQLSLTDPKELPNGLSNSDKIWNNCGFLRLSAGSDISEEEKLTLKNLTRDGLRDTQFVIGNHQDEERAQKLGVHEKLDAPKRRQRGLGLVGVFDSTGGFTEASKACLWAMHLARREGVTFILGDKAGRLDSLLENDGKVTGLRTANGKEHRGDLVIIAAGAWTASLFPDVSPLLETTAGSVAFIQIPSERKDLWKRFAPENFPVFTRGGWGKGSGLGLFPRTTTGLIKIGFRGTKYTNYETIAGKRISVPRTAYSEKPLTQITKEAIDSIKSFVKDNVPELMEFGICRIRNCWYTDSLDNNFLVDYVPGKDGLFVCSGGSGHGFKFLPILGREVVKVLEGKKNDYGKLWQWRQKNEGLKNGLEEGEEGPRVLSKQKMSTEKDYVFTDRETAKI